MSLDNLPGNDDEYWKDADIKKVKITDSPKCEHTFVRTKGNHVECKCGVGYFLSPGFEVREGHIYALGKLVI
jgi:hypothetical protein